MVMSNEWRVWVRVGGGRHDSTAGRWVMEVLLIVALGHDIYRENTRSYGFATRWDMVHGYHARLFSLTHS